MYFLELILILDYHSEHTHSLYMITLINLEYILKKSNLLCNPIDYKNSNKNSKLQLWVIIQCYKGSFYKLYSIL